MITDLAHHYISALTSLDIAKLVDLFSEEATISSPIFGEAKPTHFFPTVLKGVTEVQISLSQIYLAKDQLSAAVSFTATWRNSALTTPVLRYVDLLHVTAPTSPKLSRLEIVFDTYPLREALGMFQVSAA